MSTHKRWKTVNAPTGTERRWASQPQAYEYIEDLAADAGAGATRAQVVTVWKAEGKGAWELHETVDLPKAGGVA